MLALQERPPVSWPEYAIASPKDFYELIDFHSPKYVRALFSNNHESGRKIFLLGNRKSSKVTDLKTFKRKTTRYVQGVLNCKSEAVNNYYSPNEFYSWPKAINLALLRANWIDIDVTEKVDVRRVRELEHDLIEEVFQELKKNQLPPFTGYVCSGSGGVHLYWIYDPVEASEVNKELWKLVANIFIKSLKNISSFWHIDTIASKRAYGNLRIPGSVHGRTGLQARFFSGGPKYQFKKLLNCLNLESLRDELKIKKESRVVRLPFKPKSNEGKQQIQRRYGHNIKDWWLKCINTIQIHFRKQGKVPKGKRDKTAFILFVAFQHLNKETAFEKLIKINEELIGFSLEELDGLTKTAKITIYNYRKETLAEYLEELLGYCPEYLCTKPKVKLSKDEITQRQSKAAKSTAAKKRNNSQEIVAKAIKQLTKETGKKPTQRQVAERAGVGLRTVKRYWFC
ncbi:hypothetical protein BIW53_12010 [Pseudoalteromonas byunsanensis]|uniref:Primase C-terminal 1 domain-containing protein n=1 Tax=Pseudoalteromonas byunsanensis TaxID=327939 RepID=A0A1S1N129_9GAMM|nr:hypothetical protein BIW53_12010 [Pseudoalteromonas byunsanensis]